VNGMSEHAVEGNGDQESRSPAQLIEEVQALRSQASAAAHGFWLPLVVFGALICGSLPLYRRVSAVAPRPGLPPPGPCASLGNHPCHGIVAFHVTVVTALGFYWQLSLPAGVLLIVLWYRWRGNRVGLRTPSRGFLIAGLVLAEMVLLVPILISQSISPAVIGALHDSHQAGPLVIIAALLWVLARAERSVALAITTGCYLAAALVVSQFTNGGLAGGTTGAADVTMSQLRLLGLLPALILLGAGLAAWLAQRLRMRPGRASS
jgi:hypothetical protein